jgi:hypothetical protein
MARGNVITVKPSNNAFTVLAAAAVLAQIVALAYVLLTTSKIFGGFTLLG